MDSTFRKKAQSSVELYKVVYFIWCRFGKRLAWATKVVKGISRNNVVEGNNLLQFRHYKPWKNKPSKTTLFSALTGSVVLLSSLLGQWTRNRKYSRMTYYVRAGLVRFLRDILILDYLTRLHITNIFCSILTPADEIKFEYDCKTNFLLYFYVELWNHWQVSGPHSSYYSITAPHYAILQRS